MKSDQKQPASNSQPASTPTSPRAPLRVQFEVTEAQIERINSLIDEFPSVINSKRELFNNAVTFLRWAVDQRKLGREIGARDAMDNHFFALTFPALDEIQPKGKLTPA